jgi:hypothetical protein
MLSVNNLAVTFVELLDMDTTACAAVLDALTKFAATRAKHGKNQMETDEVCV